MARDHADGHLRAADRHQEAAETHERAARFWDEQTESERADLQREMAAFERQGAELERRWAVLVQDDPGPAFASAADDVERRARENASHLGVVLTNLAKTLDRSAELAEAHARRHEVAGMAAGAATEREAAVYARRAAARARSQAAEWAKLVEAAPS